MLLPVCESRLPILFLFCSGVLWRGWPTKEALPQPPTVWPPPSKLCCLRALHHHCQHRPGTWGELRKVALHLIRVAIPLSAVIEGDASSRAQCLPEHQKRQPLRALPQPIGLSLQIKGLGNDSTGVCHGIRGNHHFFRKKPKSFDVWPSSFSLRHSSLPHSSSLCSPLTSGWLPYQVCQTAHMCLDPDRRIQLRSELGAFLRRFFLF